MAQNSVFAQVIKQIPRTQFAGWVAQHDGDKHMRQLDCWTWFGSLLFGQLTGHDSIRAIERVFASSDRPMQRLGFRPVRRSTLADANATRPLAILEAAFWYVLQRAQQVAPQKPGLRFKGPVWALDATTIELCLSLCPWAQCHHSKGAARLHTAIDLAGDLPQFAVVTDGRTHELTVAKQQMFAPGTTVVFDRGYVDSTWLHRLNTNDVWFVTRAKKHCQFKVVESRPTNRTRGHIGDQRIYLNSAKGKQYKGTLRRSTYRDPDTGKRLTFLTNRWDLATQTLCDLYKARWRVELFFKPLKQQLRIKKFLGTSIHAVTAQIWVALIAYLLVQLIRCALKSTVSICDTLAVIGTLLLLKEPLTRLLGKLPATRRHPPGFQLSLGF